MNKIIIIFGLLLYSTQSITHLTVTNVDRHVKSRKLGREIKVGDVIAVDDTLELLSANERATLYSPEAKQNFYFNNRFLSKEANPLWVPAKRPLLGHNQVGHSELVLALKQNFLPSKIKGVLNGKSGYNESTADLRHYFSGFADSDMPLAILDKLYIALDPSAFPASETKVFVMTCKYHGKQINNAMAYTYDSEGTFGLAIDPTQLMRNKKSVNPNSCKDFLLLYYDRKTGATDTIPIPALVFPNVERLRIDCKQFKKAIISADPSMRQDLKLLVSEFIEQNYGLIDSRNFDQFYLTL